MRRVAVAAAVALLAGAGALAVVGATDSREPAPPPASGSATGEWRALTPAPLERTEVAAARIGRSIYVVGGFEERTGSTTAALERYDIRRNRWERLRSMPIGVNHPTAAAWRGRLYVHGGYRGRRDLSSATPRLYVYLPRRDRWRRLPDARAPRAAHAFAAVNGRIYAAGGANSSGSIASTEVYDIARRRWRRAPELGGPARNHVAGVAAGRFVYVLAGRNADGNLRVAERFDTRRRRWQRLPRMAKARSGIAAVAIRRGRVVVFGGEESAGTIAEVELYDPQRRRWRALPDMLTPRHGLGGVALRNRVYAVEGGPRPAFHFSNAIEFLDVR